MVGKSFIIYGLADPNTYQIRYIGLTRDPDRRRNEHCFSQHSPNHSYYSNWKKSLRSRNQFPLFVYLAEAPDLVSANRYEETWIKTARDCGVKLTNYRDGGCYFYLPRTPEWCRNISLAKVGKPRAKHSKESIEKVAAQHRGMKRTPEARSRMSAAQRANKEALAKLVARNIAGRGKRYSDERRAQMSQIMKRVRATRTWSTKPHSRLTTPVKCCII